MFGASQCVVSIVALVDTVHRGPSASPIEVIPSNALSGKRVGEIGDAQVRVCGQAQSGLPQHPVTHVDAGHGGTAIAQCGERPATSPTSSGITGRS